MRGVIREQGSALILVLVVLSVFVVIATAWAAFSSRVLQQTVRQAQEERLYRAAEAGIAQVLYRLNTLDERKARVAAAPINGSLTLTDPDDPTISITVQYVVTFPNRARDPFTVVSIGREGAGAICQVISAVLEEHEAAVRQGPTWAVREHQHVLYGTCPSPS